MDQTLTDNRKRAAWPFTFEMALGLISFLLIPLMAFIAIHRLGPPQAVSARAPLTEFSSARALQKVQHLSQKPHPIGTVENMEVRDYLFKELSALGVNPEIQRATGISPTASNSIPVGTVENIVAKLPGTNSNKAVLLIAHYDSAPNSPGANDDGAAIGALLETLRALKAGPALKNDVIFLFTDGEEPGALGASAFAVEHPWTRNVGVVLNFEARGDTGSSIMFETSDENGWLIREFAQAAPRPVANSVADELSKLRGFSTDLTAFKKINLAGLNFSYVDGALHQHVKTDSIEYVDEGSLQHHGSYALALARHFGNLDLADIKESNAVYFDVLGAGLIHYSRFWIIPLVILIVLLFAGVTILGFRKKYLTIYGMAVGVVVFVLSLVTVPPLMTLAWWFILSYYPYYKYFLQGGLYNSGLYMLGLTVFAIALTAWLYAFFRRKVSMHDLAMGAALCWVLLLIGVALYLPGASYIFSWPLLFSLLATGFVFMKKEEARAWGARLAGFSLGAIPGTILITSLAYLLFIGLGLDATGKLLALIVLLLGLLIPSLSLMAMRRKWMLPTILTLVGGGLIATAVATTHVDAAHPRPDHLFYILNADSGKAVWASLDRQPDEWSSQFLSTNPQMGGLYDYFPSLYPEYLKNEAPAIPLSAPRAELLESSMKQDVRTIRLRITSPRQSPVMTANIYTGAEMTAATVNGKSLPIKSSDRLEFTYYALPKEGIELVLAVKSSDPVKIRLTDRSYGLPTVTGQAINPRPAYLIPSPFIYSDTTVVSKAFQF
jgi:hypothetical protein